MRVEARFYGAFRPSLEGPDAHKHAPAHTKFPNNSPGQAGATTSTCRSFSESCSARTESGRQCREFCSAARCSCPLGIGYRRGRHLGSSCCGTTRPWPWLTSSGGESPIYTDTANGRWRFRAAKLNKPASDSPLRDVSLSAHYPHPSNRRWPRRPASPERAPSKLDAPPTDVTARPPTGSERPS